MSVRCVLATANPDKAREILAIVAELGEIELVERPADVPDVEETGETLEENARLKAVALRRATNTASIADDTGLEVDALGGDPGVRSARYAGEQATYEENVDKLLGELEGRTDRRARFATVALLSLPDGTELWARGVVEGAIAEHPVGEGGFGYDSVFIPMEGDGRTFAQMEPGEKNEVSHRTRALRSLAEMMAARGLFDG